MKNLYIAFVFFLSTSAYGQIFPQMLGRPKPFVELRDGKLIYPKNVEKEHWKIYADSNVFATEDVAFYSDGYETYANIAGNTFATKIVDGKINIYCMEYMEFSPMSNGGPAKFKQHTKYYIQENGKQDIFFLNYKSLRPMIPTNTPADDILKKFKRTKKTTSYILYGGLAFVTSAIVITANAGNHGSNAAVATSIALASVGVTSMLTALIIKGVNGLKITKAVRVYDGEAVKKRHSKMTFQ